MKVCENISEHVRSVFEAFCFTLGNGYELDRNERDFIREFIARQIRDGVTDADIIHLLCVQWGA